MHVIARTFSIRPMIRKVARWRYVSAVSVGVVGFCALSGGASAAPANTTHSIEVDLAGNRLEALAIVQPSQQANVESGCTAGAGLCVEILRDGDYSPSLLNVTRIGRRTVDVRFELAGVDGSQSSFTLWPHVLRLADEHSGVLLGVVYCLSTGYSGGGASASQLRLIQVAPDATAFKMREVLTIPLTGRSMIRACFSERDERQRLGACHDEYKFDATLRLDRTVRLGFPRLLYATRATSFPGHVSRDKDSLAAPPLRKRDLVTVVDQQCTYRRSFWFESSSASYVPDRPLPDCENYTVP